MIPETFPTFIIIDALDECPTHGGERAKFLELLRSLAASNPANLHILATSRKESDIEEKLTDSVTLPPLGIQEEDTDNDIRTHVKAQLMSDSTMSKWPESTKLEVEEVLTTKSKGMYVTCQLLEVRRVLTEERFRWATCQLDSLRKCLRPAAVSKTLNTLPSTLDETYERILLNIDEQYKQEAQAALTWLVASQRVLKVIELAEAVSIETDSEGLFDPSNRLFEPSTICSVLSGLVSTSSHPSDLSAYIRLAHFSVEEYLVSDRLAKSRASHFHISYEISHIRLAAASLIYLRWAKDFLNQYNGSPMWSRSPLVTHQRDNVSDYFLLWDNVPYDSLLSVISLPEKVPLLAYACTSWYLHVRMCEGYLPEREIRLVKDFLECQERVRFFEEAIFGYSDYAADRGCHSSKHALWKNNPSKAPAKIRAEPDWIASPLYYAARLGLVDVVTALLKETNRSRMSLHQPIHQGLTPGNFGDELRIACFSGRKKIVEMLLNAGADVESVGGAFKTAMGACMQSITPNPDIIQMLLERVERINPDVDWTMGWTLRWAAMEGHLSVVRALIPKINGVERENYTWTHDYLRDYERVAEETFPYGRKYLDGSESYIKHGTAPYEAASAGQHEILSLLIGNWSNIDEEDYEGRTSLYWAAFNGHTETVKLLLEHGALIHGHGYVDEWTPTYWASIKGFHEIEELLVHIDTTTTRGRRRAEAPRVRHPLTVMMRSFSHTSLQ